MTCTASHVGAEGECLPFHWLPPQQLSWPVVRLLQQRFILTGCVIIPCSHVGPLFIPSSATYAHGVVSIVRPAQFGISGLITAAEKKAHYTRIVCIFAWF